MHIAATLAGPGAELLPAHSLEAQTPTGTVIGNVATPTGEPLAEARVLVPELESAVTAFTDGQGRAALEFPAGAVELRVERLGFATAVVAGAATTVSVELEEEAFELDEVRVFSTRTGGRIEDAPIRVEVIDREEVEEKHRMTPGDIAMLLNETAGRAERLGRSRSLPWISDGWR